MATREEVLKELDKFENHWLKGRRMWSFGYHGLRFSGVIAAALTTLGTALEWAKAANLSLAAVTTVLTGASAALRPAQKWRSNRLSYSEAQVIRFSLMKAGASPDRALDRLAKLIRAHDSAIVGDVGTDIAEPGEGEDEQTG